MSALPKTETAVWQSLQPASVTRYLPRSICDSACARGSKVAAARTAAAVAARAILAETFMALLLRLSMAGRTRLIAPRFVLRRAGIVAWIADRGKHERGAHDAGRCPLVRPRRSVDRDLDPPYARNFAAAVADARDRLDNRLDGNGHVEGVGVQEARAVAHDGDMAAPEHQVAALRGGAIEVDGERGPQRLFLHVAVARKAPRTNDRV